jgi:N-acetylglucosaminyl-diphospho-decaprenol L-rhamnosyltransferase
MTAELAVVIVNYNAGPYLERCLSSLEEHRGDLETEVLVIDNASSDGSEQAADAHPNVRLIRNPTNVFLSPGWNQGIRETAAPFVLLLNPDTEWWKGTLADYVKAARDHPRAGIVGPVVREPDGRIYPSGRPFPSVMDALGHAFLSPVASGNRFTRRYHMDDWDRTSERVVDWVSGACMLFPRNVFDRVGLLDERFKLYGEELDIATRVRDAGRYVLFTPDVEIIHVGAVSTGRSRRMHVMHSASIYRYYAKHRVQGWRRILLPAAWLALWVRAQLAWILGRSA